MRSSQLLLTLAAFAWCIVASPQLHAGQPAGIEGLLATEAAPDYRQELDMFGRYVGNWDTRGEYYAPDGKLRGRAKGGIHIGWILYGTALQDVWEGNFDDKPRAQRPFGFGTTIRFFDRQLKVWRVVWIAPTVNVVQMFTARKVGDEYWLEGVAPNGHLIRWTWSDLTPNSFTYSSLESADGGVHWALDERIWATRRR